MGTVLAAGFDLARAALTGGRVLQGLLVATVALLPSLYLPLRVVFIVLGAGVAGYLFF